MTAVEDRLTAALAERADSIRDSPGSWARHQELLQQRSPATMTRRYRAPLLVAAAVLALIASVVSIRSLQHTAHPVAPAPIGNADSGGCRFGSMPGTTSAASMTMYAPGQTAGDRLVLLMQQTGRANACFFDGVGWHYAADDGQTPIQILRTSIAGGQGWLWGLLAPGAFQVEIKQDDGVLSTRTVMGTETLNGVVMAPVKASGTVTIKTQAGTLVASRRFDLSTATSSVGSVVLRTTTWNSTNAGAEAIACPAGAADATVVQSVPGAAAVTLALHARGAVGQPVVCASGGLTPIAAIATGASSVTGAALSGLDAMVIHNVDSTPRWWGWLPEKVAKLVITTGGGVGSSTFVADPAQAVNGAVLMSTLGSHRTFAAVAGLQAGGSEFQLYAADGSLITSFLS